MDIYADLNKPLTIRPGKRAKIATGLYMEIPAGYECQVRPRSGLALKKGITVINSPGTIDSDYRGHCQVLLINHGKEAVEIRPGERIGQFVFKEYERVEWVESEELGDTERGIGGFGSTGTASFSMALPEINKELEEIRKEIENHHMEIIKKDLKKRK